MKATKQDLPPRGEKFYTYEDYCKFNDDKRWEVINGVIYLMTAAPNSEHQEILLNLGREFSLYPS